MAISSHRVKIEEKKLYKKALITFTAIIGAGLVTVFIGIPLFAQAILFVAGFRKDKATSTKVVESVIAPPLLDPLPEATNTATIMVSGYGEKNAKVAIYVNEKETKNASTDTDGKFLVLGVPIKDGDNTITAVNVVGQKESSPSSSYSVAYRNKAPKLEIKEPSDGDKFTSDKKEITVSGQTDDGDIRITLNGRFIVTNSSGSFKTTYSLSDGDNELDFKAVDMTGNSIEKKIKVTYYP
jgi:hypothetical protein